MCGIAGILNRDGRPVERVQLEAMTRLLAHRGPDGGGLYLDGRLGLGHRSLTIVDRPPLNHQPMASVGGRYWVTFNGEIYNYRELRRELEAASYSFETSTDTEIIGAAYDHWGPDCQLRFNGMWAFALWQPKERVLFLSRDRFGVKPLFYLDQAHRFVFASELKAFRQLESFVFDEDTESLRAVLANTSALEGTEVTPIRGVKRLRSGHCMWVRDGRIEMRRWWNTIDHLVDVPSAFDEQVQEFRQLLADACRLRFCSSVPLAACVSGGLDSSAVLCTAALQADSDSAAPQGAALSGRRRLVAYHAAFPGTRCDEADHAEQAIRQAEAVGYRYQLSQDEILEHLPQAIYDVEEIWGTMPSAIWGLFRKLREDGIVVAVGGDGADELLGGYQGYAEIELAASGGPLRRPRRALDLVATAAGLYSPERPLSLAGRVRLLAASDPVARSLWRRIIRPLIVRRSSGSPADETGWQPLRDAGEEAAIDRLGALNARLYRDFHDHRHPANLRDLDRCSMAHGVELRMPFMDFRLVRFVLSLPGASKVGGGFTKRILREAMRGILPEPLRVRTSKIGFGAPLEDWFGGSLRDWVWEQVNDADFLQSDLWDGRAVREVVSNNRGLATWPAGTAHLMWPLLHVNLWRKELGQCRRSVASRELPLVTASDLCESRVSPR